MRNTFGIYEDVVMNFAEEFCDEIEELSDVLFKKFADIEGKYIPATQWEPAEYPEVVGYDEYMDGILAEVSKLTGAAEDDDVVLDVVSVLTEWRMVLTEDEFHDRVLHYEDY